jgi:hypothetical protein
MTVNSGRYIIHLHNTYHKRLCQKVHPTQCTALLLFSRTRVGMALGYSRNSFWDFGKSMICNWFCHTFGKS